MSEVEPAFKHGDRVEKISGSSWRGVVVGEYRTSLTPEGYAVESEREPGSVQIYPAKALRLVDTTASGSAGAGEVDEAIRIAVWNACRDRGMGQDAATGMVLKVIANPMIRAALAALAAREEGR